MINSLKENRQTIARLAGSLLALVLLVILVREESGAEITAAIEAHFHWFFPRRFAGNVYFADVCCCPLVHSAALCGG